MNEVKREVVCTIKPIAKVPVSGDEISVKTEEDLKIEFIDEYNKLCQKYGMTFVQGQIKVVKI